MRFSVIAASCVVAGVLVSCVTSYHGNTATKLAQARTETQRILTDCAPDGGACPASQVRANAVIADCLVASALADGKEPGGDGGPKCPKVPQ